VASSEPPYNPGKAANCLPALFTIYQHRLSKRRRAVEPLSLKTPRNRALLAAIRITYGTYKKMQFELSPWHAKWLGAAFAMKQDQCDAWMENQKC
jgi:hypothetical protein